MTPTLRTYECSVPRLIFEGTEYSKSVFALTAGKARYQVYLDLQDAGWDVGFKDIRVRSSSGGVTVSMPQLAAFAETAKRRGVPFARIGMRVEVDGHAGVLVGRNDSANFDVLFTEGPHQGQKGNCHPHWKMKYFDADGRVLKEF